VTQNRFHTVLCRRYSAGCIACSGQFSHLLDKGRSFAPAIMETGCTAMAPQKGDAECILSFRRVLKTRMLATSAFSGLPNARDSHWSMEDSRTEKYILIRGKGLSVPLSFNIASLIPHIPVLSHPPPCLSYQPSATILALIVARSTP
jgi:hypothetical protein